MANPSGEEERLAPVDDVPVVDLRPPRISHVIVIALLVGLFAAVWLVGYTKISDLIWQNSFVTSHRWTIPIGILFFSLLVGLTGKFMHAANMIEGDATESFKAGDVTTYKTFWGTLLSSFFSLFSGASIGPEGALGFLAVQVSEWLAARLRFTKEGALGVALAGMSSAYNGVVGNPVFATLLASEVSGGARGFGFVATNLAAGAIGFLVFALLGIPAFAGFLNVGAPVGISVVWVIWALGLGLAGAIVAIYIALVVRAGKRFMGVFDQRPLLRIMVAAVIIAAVCYLIPDLMFSGEKVIHSIMASPAQYGVPMLLLMALIKPILLALSLKSGYLGGPIFPALFTAAMIALAINLVDPNIPLSILIPCLEVAVVTLLLRAPLTAILLVAVVTGAGASADQLGLVTVSAATSLGIGVLLQKAMAKRQSLAQPAAA
jgi:H+/Cl- antiporter ClcA